MEEESMETSITAERENIRCGFLLTSVVFSLIALCVLYIQARSMKLEIELASQITHFSRGTTPISYWPRHANYGLAADTEIPGWRKNVSRNVAEYIDTFHDTTIISGQEICENPNTELIIIVPTAPSEFAKRTVIRQTWASHGIHEVKVGFIVGLANDKSMQTSLEQENEQFHDVIQEDLVDTYSNITLKSVTLLKWYIQRCQNSSFLMKVDDDTFLDVEMLFSQLADFGQHGRLILAGRLCDNCAPNRDVTSKWYTPTYMFEYKVFPDYLLGQAYLMSMDVAIKLFAAALASPIFHLEDVYITGICAQEAGVKHIAYTLFGNESDVENCLRKKEDCLPKYTIYHSVNSTSMRSLWEIRKNRRTSRKS